MSRVAGLKIVIVSAVHDYRMARRGSIQAIADAFCRAGAQVTFLSVRFSALSRLKKDSRLPLNGRANRLEIVQGVACYLWRTPLHPFATGSDVGDRLTAPLHDLYANWPSAAVDRLFSRADVALVESGLGVLLVPRIRRLNPDALIVYRGSDALDTIGAHPLLQERLERTGDLVDHYCLLARGIASGFAFARAKTFFVGQGIRPEDFETDAPSPYGKTGPNAVCVGSMLFDRSFFELARIACPEVTFHVIGCGADYTGGGNLRFYPEMPFKRALPYMKFADVGIAPYREAPGAHYLADSSLKLHQYAYLRLPAVCPHFAVGEHRRRFGYTPGARGQIEAAIRAALVARSDPVDALPLSWDELVPRFLKPQEFDDTAIDASFFRSERQMSYSK